MSKCSRIDFGDIGLHQTLIIIKPQIIRYVYYVMYESPTDYFYVIMYYVYNH